MSTYAVDPQRCTGCGVCVRFCPVGAIDLSTGRAQIVEEKCIDCGVCARKCPFGAIKEIVSATVSEAVSESVPAPQWNDPNPVNEARPGQAAGGFRNAGGRGRRWAGGGMGRGWGRGRGGGGMRGRGFGAGRGRNNRFGGGW